MDVDFNFIFFKSQPFCISPVPSVRTGNRDCSFLCQFCFFFLPPPPRPGFFFVLFFYLDYHSFFFSFFSLFLCWFFLFNMLFFQLDQLSSLVYFTNGKCLY